MARGEPGGKVTLEAAKQFEFLEEFDVFAPAKTGRTRDLEPPEMMRGFLHCYYRYIYAIRPVVRELNNTVVWLSCGFDRLSKDAVDCFLAEIEHIGDQVFDRLAKQAALWSLLDVTCPISYLSGFASLAVKSVFDLLTITMLAGVVMIGLAATGSISELLAAMTGNVIDDDTVKVVRLRFMSPRSRDSCRSVPSLSS